MLVFVPKCRCELHLQLTVTTSALWTKRSLVEPGHMFRRSQPFVNQTHVSRNSRTFRAHLGCHNFLRIFKKKYVSRHEIFNKFALSYLEIIVKDRLFRITGSQFLKWFFGPEKFTGLSRNGPQGLVVRKPINANPRLKINQGVYFFIPKRFSMLMFCKLLD